MLNKCKYILLFAFSLNIIFSDEIAIVTKNNGTVKYKKDKHKSFKNKINTGMELYDNDLLVTGSDGFIMFAYLDDGSLIKVYKDSQVYVTGDLKNKIIDKKIIIDDGFFNFDIKNQKKNEFKVVTPTSVASVKGTSFYIDINEQKDIFYGIEGIVEVLNIESNKVLTLSKSKKITSSNDGIITVDSIDQKDFLYIEQVQVESGVYKEDLEQFNDNQLDSGSLYDNNSNAVNELIINLTNSSGENKKFRIKFIQK